MSVEKNQHDGHDFDNALPDYCKPGMICSFLKEPDLGKSQFDEYSRRMGKILKAYSDGDRRTLYILTDVPHHSTQSRK